MTFRTKTIVGIALIESVLLLFLIWNSLRFLSESSERALYERSSTTARLFATTTKNAVLATDLAFLESYVEEFLSNPGVVFARVSDNERVLAQAGDPALLQENAVPDVTLDGVDDGVFNATMRISEAGVDYGRVDFGLSVRGIQQTMADASTRMASIAVLEIGLVALFSFFLGTYLTRQLQQLNEASQSIAAGGPGVQVEVRGDDELARTARAFNLMSSRLKDSYDRLHDAYHDIVGSVSDGILTLDRDGNIVDCNPMAERIFKVTREQALAQPIARFIPAPFDFRRAGFGHGEIGGHTAAGESIPLDVSISTVEVTGEEPVHTLIIRDMTERKRLEEQLTATARQLEIQNKQLQEFAYVASHDLQEPLRKVRTYGDILLEECGDDVPGDGRLYIERIQESANRMDTLITDLLQYSRTTTRPVQRRTVALEGIVDEVLSDLEVAIAESGVSIEREPLPTLYADRTQMRQLLQNLISNALKFRAEGRPPVIRISYSQTDAPLGDGDAADLCPCHRIEVADNGIGFDPSYAERIFEVFERLNPRHHFTGTGIGLAVCRRIVEQHGGKIRGYGIPGEGARFEILLPMKLSETL